MKRSRFHRDTRRVRFGLTSVAALALPVALPRTPQTAATAGAVIAKRRDRRPTGVGASVIRSANGRPSAGTLPSRGW